MRRSPSPSWKQTASLLLLSLVPVAAGAARLLQLLAGAAVTPDNVRFMTAPWPVGLHIVCASLFAVIGAFQFDASLRLRRPRLHRVGGKLAAASGVVAALTGLWMTVGSAIPAQLQGGLLCVARIVVSLSMTLAIALAVRAVRRRRVARHQAWMLRAYALGQGAGTQVLILLPLTLIAGAPTFLLRDALMAAAWGLNTAFAEWVIRRRLPPVPFH